MGVTLLGPQRHPTVDRVVRSLGLSGPVATVTAGWQEREADDIELDEQLDGRSVNLRLYERWGDIQRHDPEFARATRRRRDELQELRHTYLIRLGHARAAVLELGPEEPEHGYAQRRAPEGETGPLTTGAVAIDRIGGDAVRVEVGGDDTGEDDPGDWGRRSAVRAEARLAAVDDVRRIDAEHIARLDRHNAEFIARWEPHARPAVAHHRAEIAAQLRESAALALAGGHVAVLLALLHLFAVDPPRRLPIVAWSAGAMAITERVVLYHDRTVQGPSSPEVYGRGLGIVKHVVAMPHARDRLLLGDPDRMTVMHDRFAPARCVVLDPGARLDIGEAGDLPPAATVVLPDGLLGPAGQP